MNERAKTIRRLKVLEKDFPEDLMLFAGASRSLLLVETASFKIVEEFGIRNDGGDPGTRLVDGEEYLSIE